MSAKASDFDVISDIADKEEINSEVNREAALLQTGALQSAIFNSANFSSIATDAKGVLMSVRNGCWVTRPSKL